ncbi:glycosyltransferase [Halobacillus sp. A1]|uniref:glycosyltransferase n=1 Tax=Halobacillus sp. A1 TaxID=2880262 RepID=UPI0020A6614A|nr:glycosyltransferase [Halobacillus sp. A1]MCP3030055.1 glycosyltransferase [Halobacillus sp. A1]
MKKKILFVIDSLNCAGAEKSLVTLLSLLDYSKFEVDLMLFSQGGELQSLVPKEVNILNPISYTLFTSLGLKDSIRYTLKKLEFRKFHARTKYSIFIRKGKPRNVEKARLYWQSSSKVIESNSKEYDIAISYAQGIPTFYVAEKVNARRKFAWVNVSYSMNKKDKDFQSVFYDQFEKVVAVSTTTKKIFLETFPQYSKKTTVIYDINDFNLISEMAGIGEKEIDYFKGVKILTVGRLDYQKGYDIALDACEKLKKAGVDFKWYVLGKGPLKEEIIKEVEKRNIGKHLILLGIRSNPYPIFKSADLYVQTSKFEGFGLAIAEARMLNIPVVTTEFDAVYNQMINGKNGLVVGMNGESVFQGIMKLLNNQGLKEEIINYLKLEKKGNIEEVEKFYDLIS